METWAKPDDRARRLAGAFWPGPLTLVIPDGKGGDVGLRCPDMECTRRLLRLAEVPVAAPSANLSGSPPATDAAGVMEVFGGKIAAVVDGGSVCLGVASTVVLLTGDECRILRAGALPEARIMDVLGGRNG
jgi:L-threonylcarbamoyladenylate synthase